VAAEEPLVTDRPDFTESSSSVGKGYLQFESGFTFVEFEGGTDVATIPEILARWGVTERLELRFLLPTYSRENSSGSDSSGFLGSGLGLKYQFADGDGSGFLGGMEASVIAATSIPTGTADYASSDWQPTGVLCVGWELGSEMGLGANLGIARPADGENRFTSVWLSSALGISITDPLSVFFELIAFEREEDRGPSTLTFQAGAVYLLSPDLQLDLRLARRLSDSGPDFLIGTGVSWRLGG
jgi:hypothetical protein